jgi:hypothetical protein
MSSTLRWFGRTALALLLVGALPQSARAAFIDLISQSYMIHASGFYGPASLPVVDYRETSDTPISRYDPSVLVPNDIHPEGTFTLFTSAQAGITPASAFVKAESFQTSLGIYVSAFAEASAAIAFRPLVADVVVRNENFSSIPFYEGCCWWAGNSGLYDLTTGTAVLAFQSTLFGNLPADHRVSLNPEHLYSLYAVAPSVFISGAKLSISPAGPVPTPESGSTLTFFVVGLGALLLVARSQKFRPSN